MKHYLEIIEQLSDEDSEDMQPQMIRLEVQDKDEARAKLPKVEKDLVPQSDKSKILKRFHTCKHKENEPCLSEDL